MTLFALIFALVLGAVVGLAISAFFVKLQRASGLQVRMLGGTTLRMFLPGITVGMVVAMFAFPPAPPTIGALVAEPAVVSVGNDIKLVARQVRRSADDLVWEGLDGTLQVIFYLDKNGNGLPELNETLGDGAYGFFHGGDPACLWDTRDARPGNHVCLAQAAVGGRHSNVAKVSVTIRP